MENVGPEVGFPSLEGIFAAVAVVTAIASYLFASIFKRRSLMLAHVAADLDPKGHPPKLRSIPIPDRWLTFALAAVLFVPLIFVYGLGVTIEATQRTLAQSNSLDPFAADAISISLGMALELLNYFFPMLAFATAVSIYYRDRVRAGLLAARGAAETQKDAGA